MGLVLVVLLAVFMAEADASCRHPWVHRGEPLLLEPQCNDRVKFERAG